MIKATLYLPNGKYVSVFIKRRQYKSLAAGPERPLARSGLWPGGAEGPGKCRCGGELNPFLKRSSADMRHGHGHEISLPDLPEGSTLWGSRSTAQRRKDGSK